MSDDTTSEDHMPETMPETIAELPAYDPEAPPEPPVDPELQEAIDGWWQAVESIEKLTAQKEACAWRIVQHLTPGEELQGLTVTKPSQRFDPRKAKKELTTEELADISVPVPNADLARSRLAPYRLAACTATVAPFVRRVQQP